MKNVMLKKLLIIGCRLNYHYKTRLIDVKIGFGPSNKIETVECQICKKIYIRGNESFNPIIILIAILLFLLIMLFF